MGNSTAVPKPEPYKWVTLDEAKKFKKLLGKNFVPKDDAKFAKKFFYSVIALIPKTPAGIEGSTAQHGLNVLIQKYDRTKTEKVSVATPGGGRETIEGAAKVVGHKINDDGFWECVDSTASMMLDAREFVDKYALDAEEVED